MISTSDDRNWHYDEHMAVKHRVLAYYLKVWCDILGQARRNLVFWDCFAGRGNYADGELGSPLIALDESCRCENGITGGKEVNLSCVFIEANIDNYKYLQNLLREKYPEWENKKWYVLHGDFKQIYPSLLEDNEFEFIKRKYPNFFFIDPYGLDIPLDLVKKIMKPPKHEVLLNFMVESVKRVAGLQCDSQKLLEMFGVDDLSDLRKICSEDYPDSSIIEYYRQRLKDKAAVSHVSLPFKVIPVRRSVILYSLIFCSNHILGLKKMHEIMGRVSGNDDFSFRGKNEGQRSLDFYIGNRIEKIADFIYARFSKYDTLWTFDAIVQMMLDKTYSEPDLRKAVLKLEAEGRIEVIPVGKRIRNSLANHNICFKAK